MARRIEFKPAAFRGLAKLPRSAQKRIITRVDALAEDPFPPRVKKFTGEDDLYRVRVGDYRVVYQAQGDALLVLEDGCRRRPLGDCSFRARERILGGGGGLPILGWSGAPGAL